MYLHEIAFYTQVSRKVLDGRKPNSCLAAANDSVLPAGISYQELSLLPNLHMWAVQKVSDMVFFPRKLIKYGKCPVVERWKVPSCAYVDFFPPADSVSHVQPACE